MSRRLLALALLLCVSGCATSTLTRHDALPGQLSSAGHVVDRNLDASITGIYLFYFLPLWSGEYRYPNEHDYRTFSHYVRPKYIHLMLERYRDRHKLGAIEDLKTEERSSGIWTLWIFWKREIRAHAVGTVREKKSEKSASKPDEP